MPILHRARLILVSIFTISLLLTPSALASKPEFNTFPVDDSFIFGECDGFSVEQHIEGTIKVSTHFDNNGDFKVEILRYRLRDTYTNSVTGESLSFPEVGIDKITIDENGDTIRAIIGIVRRVVVPGEGVVFAHLGRVVVNLSTGEVIFEAGPHQDFDELLPALCSALA